jgi:hypothetical protein
MPWRRMGDWMYRSTFSWPRHSLEMSGQLHAPAALPPRKRSRYPLYRRLGGLQSRSGRRGEENNSWPYLDSNFDLLVVRPIASHYTNYTILHPVVDQYEGKWKHFETHNYIKIQNTFWLHTGFQVGLGKDVRLWYMDPLLAWHGASSGWRWTKWPPAMKHYCKYTQ